MRPRAGLSDSKWCTATGGSLAPHSHRRLTGFIVPLVYLESFSLKDLLTDPAAAFLLHLTP